MIAVKTEGFDLRSRNGATCSICGAGDYNPQTGGKTVVVATGVQIEMEGLFDVCGRCVAEMAGLIGYVSDAAYRLLAAEYEEQTRDVKELLDKIKDKESTIRLLSAEIAGGSYAPTPVKPPRKKPGPKPNKPSEAAEPKLPIGLQ